MRRLPADRGVATAGEFRREVMQNSVVENEIRESARVSNLRGAFDIFFSWSTISLMIWSALKIDSSWYYFFSVVVIGSRQHALLSLMHDAVHWHLFTHRKVNDFASDLFCAMPHLFITRYYRNSHLAHHRELNSLRDPDWVRKDHELWQFPKSRLSYLKFVLWNGLLSTFRRVPTFIFTTVLPKNHSRRVYIYLCAMTTFFVTFIVIFIPLNLFVFYWLVPAIFVLPVLGIVRSVAEHFGLSYSDELNSARDVRGNFLERAFFGPVGICFHLTHHLFPEVPRYRLERVHICLVKFTDFADRAKISSSYILPIARSLHSDVVSGLDRKVLGGSHDE